MVADALTLAELLTCPLLTSAEAEWWQRVRKEAGETSKDDPARRPEPATLPPTYEPPEPAAA